MGRTGLAAAIMAAGLWLVATPAIAPAAEKYVSCTEDRGWDPDALIAACSKIIEGRGGNADYMAYVFTQRGNGLGLKGRIDEALADYDRAIELQPKWGWLRLNRAAVWARKRDDERALADYTEAIRLEPRLSLAYLGRSSLWIRRGELAKAIDEADKAVGIEPKSYRTLNISCWARGVAGADLDRALRNCDQAMRWSRNMPAVYDSRGLVHLRRNEFADAVADTDTALKLAPKQAPSLFVRGVAKLRLGRTAEGQADLVAAEALEPGIRERYAGWGVTP